MEINSIEPEEMTSRHCPREGCPGHRGAGPEHDHQTPCPHCGYPGLKRIAEECSHYQFRINAVQPEDPERSRITCLRCQERFVIPRFRREVLLHAMWLRREPCRVLQSPGSDPIGVYALIPTMGKPDGEQFALIAEAETPREKPGAALVPAPAPEFPAPLPPEEQGVVQISPTDLVEEMRKLPLFRDLVTLTSMYWGDWGEQMYLFSGAIIQMARDRTMTILFHRTYRPRMGLIPAIAMHLGRDLCRLILDGDPDVGAHGLLRLVLENNPGPPPRDMNGVGYHDPGTGKVLIRSPSATLGPCANIQITCIDVQSGHPGHPGEMPGDPAHRGEITIHLGIGVSWAIREKSAIFVAEGSAEGS